MLRMPEPLREKPDETGGLRAQFSEIARRTGEWDMRRRVAAGAAVAAMLLVAAFVTLRYAFPHEARAFVVEDKPVAWRLKGPGVLDATNRVTVTARINGRLKWIGVDRNDPVRAGQTIARLEAEDLANLLGGARADADAAAKAIVQARSNRARAAAGLQKLQQDLDRRKRLIVSGAVSRAELDATELAVRAAEAESDSAESAVARAVAQARAADANVAATAARLDDATLISPLDGVVVTRDRNVGDVVTPGSPVLQVVDPASVVVSARFDESVMGVLTPGQNAAIFFTSIPNRAFQGKVVRIARQVDQETREFVVDISLDSLPPNWALGQRTSVHIDVESRSPHALAPTRYIRRAEGQAGVWVARDGRAAWRALSLGHAIGPLVEVREGLAIGDTVLDPAGRYAGQRVRPAFEAP